MGTSHDPGTDVSRRQLVAALGGGAAAGVGGCLQAGGDGGGDSGDDDDGGETPAGSSTAGSSSFACPDLTAGYVPFDAGASVMIADFELPEAYDGKVTASGEGSIVRGQRDFQYEGGRRALKLTVQQMMDKSNVKLATADRVLPDETPPPRDVVLEIEFNGRTAEFFRPFTVKQLDAKVGLQGDLSYVVDGHRLWFPFAVLIAYANPPDSLPETCLTAMDESTRHMVDSLAVNADTTVAEAVREWDDWPWDWLE